MDTENPKTAIEYIHSLGRFSGKPGLHRIKALCEALGNPQDRLKFVHLAGTNGKGSTACMIASTLQAAGLRTGLYTSPYLVQFYERIRVDGVMISDDDLTRLCERVTVACESLTLPEGETIGEFEFTTALAFLCFVEQECDIVVLETGLGGRCDATNVIKNAGGLRDYADFARPYGGARQHNGGHCGREGRYFQAGYGGCLRGRSAERCTAGAAPCLRCGGRCLVRRSGGLPRAAVRHQRFGVRV